MNEKTSEFIIPSVSTKELPKTISEALTREYLPESLAIILIRTDSEVYTLRIVEKAKPFEPAPAQPERKESGEEIRVFRSLGLHGWCARKGDLTAYGTSAEEAAINLHKSIRQVPSKKAISHLSHKRLSDLKTIYAMSPRLVDTFVALLDFECDIESEKNCQGCIFWSTEHQTCLSFCKRGIDRLNHLMELIREVPK